MKNKYAIRKLSVAVGSVIIGTTLFVSGEAKADEIKTNDGTVQQNEVAQEPTKETPKTQNENVEQNNNQQTQVETKQENQLPQFITNSEVKTEKDDNGQTPIWSKQQVNYEWNATQYKKGDVINFDLPKEVRLANEQNFDLNTPDNITIGSVNATTNGAVTVNLKDENNYLATHQNTQGWIKFETMFNRDVVKDDQPFEIKVGDKTYKGFIAKNEANKTPLQKFGYIDDDKKIRWDVNVNFDQQTIDNAKVTDTLGEGQTLDEDSVEVYEYDTDTNKATGTYAKDKWKLTPTTNGFVIDFLEQIKSSYQIEYTTMPLRGLNKPYQNSVELTGTGYDTASKTVDSEVSNSDGGGEGNMIPEKPSEPEQPQPEEPSEPKRPDVETPENPEPNEPNEPVQPKPEEPNKPNVPEPNTPEVPDTPEQPDVPKTDEPEQPNNETPETPKSETPKNEIPNKSETPNTPREEIPNKPNTETPYKANKEHLNTPNSINPKELNNAKKEVSVTPQKHVSDKPKQQMKNQKESESKTLPETGQSSTNYTLPILTFIGGLLLTRKLKANKEDK
ncbi:collagen binding domain-containing protein [Staphylococcus simiae]|uniref:Surface anchored protein n=1 Tax=Staphylococcus simiae CCM 7213 = CCUG 51256 TaxID=911238 RepID=G5JH47_9STAP|nr:collagen binding domain-containing protein [Staphylococcus simiae]EHJ08395.1 surface anchored protein [Staphylococcus simiae CCM 7213 = CCUG 51256]PNZ12645.1 hypothetical protein CD113_06415 [Staphylococcus simiae]SNV66908.1 putative LPXTG cell wall-anchored protein (pseudogene) [Staphylococcus simiae]